MLAVRATRLAVAGLTLGATLACAAPPPARFTGSGSLPSTGRIVSPDPARDAAPSPRGQVVTTARRMLGAPYRYGGRTPAGFDCSGLVGYSYASAGWRELPHSAAALFSRARPIPLDELLPGDLLFFRFGRDRVSHVALYVGDGRFIHAPKSGGVVEQVDFTHPYWQSQLGLAGRLIAP